MANCIMGFPNYIDNTFYNVVLTGGDWKTPLTNLQNPRLSLPAIANGSGNAATWFEVDMGAPRDLMLGAIPSTNSTLDGTYQLEITLEPAFSNETTVGANASAGGSSVTFEAPGGTAITVTAGDFFTIDGYLYKSDTTTTIAAGGTGAISLAAASGYDIHNATLQDDITDGMAIRCNTGDYSTPAFDNAGRDIFQRIYPWGSLPWQHPSFWDGKATEEERQTLKFPIIDVMTDEVIVGMYARYSFFDDTNPADFAVSRCFLTPGWQPTINPAYGAGFQYQTDTEFEKSWGGEKSYAVKQAYRTLAFTIDHLPEDEALAQALEMQRIQGIDKQMFFIFNPEDSENLHRRSFTATLQSLDPLSYAYFNHMSFNGVIEEVQGGLLT